MLELKNLSRASLDLNVKVLSPHWLELKINRNLSRIRKCDSRVNAGLDRIISFRVNVGSEIRNSSHRILV